MIVTLAVWLPPLLAAALPQKFGAFLESGPRERALRTAGKAAFWALIAAWFLLVGTTISMRIKASRAVTSFNSANSGRGLPSAAVEDASNGEKMTLEASKGSAFGMLWSAALLLLAVILLERRRARRADAVAQARADIEAQAGRKVWEAPGQPPSAAPCPAQPALSAPIPLEYTRTASPAPTYFTGSERRVDMEGEALTWRLVGDKTGQLYN